MYINKIIFSLSDFQIIYIHEQEKLCVTFTYLDYTILLFDGLFNSKIVANNL